MRVASPRWAPPCPPPPPPHHDRPERWCHRLVTASRGPGARRSPSPGPGPGGRGRVGRGPGSGGGKGAPTRGGEGARAAEMRLPAAAPEARGGRWQPRARRPRPSRGARVAGGWGWVDSWARLPPRRKAQGRHRPTAGGFRRGLGLACPSPCSCGLLWAPCQSFGELPWLSSSPEGGHTASKTLSRQSNTVLSLGPEETGVDLQPQISRWARNPEQWGAILLPGIVPVRMVENSEHRS